VHIRAARSEDWKACLELDISYHTEAAWQMNELGNEGECGVCFREVRLPRKQRIMPLLSPDARLKGWQRRDGFWVVVDKRKIVGYLALVIELDHAQARVKDLAIAPELRRQGLATELLRQATEWSLNQNLEQVVLEFPLKAQPAIAFALRQGFSFCGFQDAYWPGQETALFFRKRIK